MEDLERAILVLFNSPSASTPIALEANAYFERVKADPNGWQLGLALFVSIPRRDPTVRVSALNIIEDIVKSKHHAIDPSQLIYLRQTLWSWTQSALDNTDPPYVRKKLVQILVTIFRFQYPETWPTFFDDILALLKDNVGTPRSDITLDFFLTVCESIHEQVVIKDGIRADRDNMRNTAIKDKMRERAVGQLRDAWFSLLNHYWKNRDLRIIGTILRIIGFYVEWVDIKLIVEPGFISSLYEFICIPELRIPAVECLTGITEKGMPATEKLDLIQVLGLTNLLDRLFSGEIDDELADALGKLVNALGMDLCSCWRAANNAPEMRHGSLLHLEKSFHILSIFLKMKYDEDEPNAVGEAAGEAEAAFGMWRKVLKGKLETISSIDSNVYMAALSSTVISTFGRIDQGISWSEAELALYLISILKGNAVTPAIEEMIKTMIRCGVSTYQHPLIPIVFFDNIAKYPEYLPEVLNAFMDTRGLRHENAAVRSRLYYLFLRFLRDGKSLRVVLTEYAASIVLSFNDHLRIELPGAPTSPARSPAGKDELTATIFDSQLYAFEAVGYLISLDDENVQKQQELLKVVLEPLMTSLQAVLGSTTNAVYDLEVAQKTGQPVWVSMFKQALHMVILALERFNEHEVVREAARFTYQRLVGCVGEDVLPFFNPLVSAGLFRTSSLKELSNFLPSVGQLMHNFKASVFPILNEVLTPIIERIFISLNQTPSGYDETKELIELKKAYLNFVNSIFINDLEGTLITEANSRHLNAILESCLLYACDPSDFQVQKLALSLISKMALSWGSAASASSSNGSRSSSTESLVGVPPIVDKKSGMVGLKVDKKSRAQAEFAIGIGGKNPLPGFDKFLYENVSRTMFEIPLKPGFDMKDAGSMVVIQELAAVHRTILMVQGREYLQFLQAFLPTIQCPPDKAVEFVTAIQNPQSPKSLVLVLKIKQKTVNSLLLAYPYSPYASASSLSSHSKPRTTYIALPVTLL
ncbi:armadillo-type protein [Chytridium lagenaria]|nr:armadillo-type protein [Chytridium lagenaria]